jgi:hypothetical protein
VLGQHWHASVADLVEAQAGRIDDVAHAVKSPVARDHLDRA